MDIVNFPGIIAEHGLLDSSQVSLTKDLILIGKQMGSQRDGTQYENMAITIAQFANLIGGGNETLAQTLVLGNTTSGTDIIISNGDNIVINSGAFFGTFVPPVLAGNVNWVLPSISGTIALLSDIPGPEGLATTLGISNTTSGNNIFVTAGDNISFGDGIFSGVLDTLALTGNHFWNLPNQSGTIALLSDIPPVGNTIYTGDGTVGSGRVVSITDTLTFLGNAGMFMIQDGTEGIPGYIWTSIDAFGTGAWIPSPTASTNIYNADGTITDATRTVTLNTYLNFVSGNLGMGASAIAGDRLRLNAAAGYDGALNIGAFNLANGGYGILVQGGSGGANYNGIWSDANGGSTNINRAFFGFSGVAGSLQNYGAYFSARNGTDYSVGVYGSSNGGDGVIPSEFAAGVWGNSAATLPDDRRAFFGNIYEAVVTNNAISYGIKLDIDYVSVVVNEVVYGVHSRANVDGAGVTNVGGYFFAGGTSATNHALVTDGGNIGFGTTTPSNQALLELVSTNQAFLIMRMTAAEASGITPANGMGLYVTDTNATFTSVGFWKYQAGAWITW